VQRSRFCELPRVKNFLRPAAFLLAISLIVGLAQEASSEGRPKSFGVPDLESDDPREFGRGHHSDYPTWSVGRETPNDVFTFARLRYPSYSDRRFRGGRWNTDYPDSDLNMSYRLQQMTSLQVNPNGVVCDIEPEQIRHYPFLYMVEVGHIDLSDEQAKTLRDYLLNGGFLMVDDFWGIDAWDNFHIALKQIFPDRDFVELEIDHDIFHCVFDLKVKPQIAHISYKESILRGITWEFDKPGSETVHYRGIYDDKKRLCMVICWNTDTGEGWEQEGADPWYFKEFSERYAYPIGINIIMHALTH
jgi:hypothetical protein